MVYFLVFGVVTLPTTDRHYEHGRVLVAPHSTRYGIPRNGRPRNATTVGPPTTPWVAITRKNHVMAGRFTPPTALLWTGETDQDRGEFGRGDRA